MPGIRALHDGDGLFSALNHRLQRLFGLRDLMLEQVRGCERVVSADYFGWLISDF
jgi:hypothetical protein